MSSYEIFPLPSSGRWFDLRQREAKLEEEYRVLHYQQQARFQYGSDVPNASVVSPTHAAFGPPGEHV